MSKCTISQNWFCLLLILWLDKMPGCVKSEEKVSQKDGLQILLRICVQYYLNMTFKRLLLKCQGLLACEFHQKLWDYKLMHFQNLSCKNAFIKWNVDFVVNLTWWDWFSAFISMFVMVVLNHGIAVLILVRS